MENFENMEIAGLAIRAVAFIIDQIIIAIVMFILLVLGIGSMLGITVISGGELAPISIMGAISIGIFAWLLRLIYFTFLEARSGQTIGKKIMKIRVIKMNGDEMDYVAAFVRNLLRIIDQLPTLYIIGFLLIIITKENQRIGDMVAGTILVTD